MAGLELDREFMDLHIRYLDLSLLVLHQPNDGEKAR